MIWPEVSLGEICKPKQHKIIPKSELIDEGFVVYGANGPIGYYSDYTHDRTTIAVTCRGATCGTINVVPPNSYITGNAMALDDLDEDKADLGFLRYALEHQGFASVINGAAQPQITRAPLLKYSIPLPPLDEQKRIAAILDQADTLRLLRQRAVNRLNTLGQAIFHEMFLTSEDYPQASLAELGSVVTGSTPPTSNREYFDGNVPFVTPGDLESKQDIKRSLTELGASKSRTVGRGATLVCCIGATIGKIDQAQSACSFNQQINAVEWGHSINHEYGMYAILQKKAEIIHKGKGASTTLPILKKSEFQKVLIPVAPIEKQIEFARRINLLKAAQESNCKAHGVFELLFDSLQARAFRGELQ